MGIPEDQGAEFHDRDEAGEIMDLLVWVPAIEDAGKVEEFGTLVNLGPETLFQALFCLSLDGELFNEIEVSEDPYDLGETMRLKDVEEFKGFLRARVNRRRE